MGLDSGDAIETGVFSVRGEGTEAEPPKVVKGPQLRESPRRAYNRKRHVERVSEALLCPKPTPTPPEIVVSQQPHSLVSPYWSRPAPAPWAALG